MARKIPEQKIDDSHCHCAPVLMVDHGLNAYGQKVYVCKTHKVTRIIGEKKTREAAGVMTVSQEAAMRVQMNSAEEIAKRKKAEDDEKSRQDSLARLMGLEESLTQ